MSLSDWEYLKHEIAAMVENEICPICMAGADEDHKKDCIWGIEIEEKDAEIDRLTAEQQRAWNLLQGQEEVLEYVSARAVEGQE